MIAFIFSYLGITFFSFTKMDWSWHLIAVLLGTLIVGRFGATVGLLGIFQIFGYESYMTYKEMFFIGYAGLIRGAIAFGLVLRLNDVGEHRSIIVTTC